MTYKTLIVILFLYSGISYGQQHEKYGIESRSEPRGLQVGDIAPDFKLTDQQGELVHLYQILDEQPVVLIFYRGFWCPVCNRYLSNVEDSIQMILEAGSQLIAVTPELYEGREITIRRTDASFRILSDTSETTINAYKVGFKVTMKYQRKIKTFFRIDIATNNGQEQARLPVPATYVIKKDREIAFVQLDPDYHYRTSVREMLAVLNKL